MNHSVILLGQSGEPCAVLFNIDCRSGAKIAACIHVRKNILGQDIYAISVKFTTLGHVQRENFNLVFRNQFGG